MRNKSSAYVCLNENDKTFLEKENLEEVLGAEPENNERRSDNVRKSIERYLERQKLKKNIIDFHMDDEYDEH